MNRKKGIKTDPEGSVFLFVISALRLSYEKAELKEICK